jgi:uncharacterized protein (DUF302 family)
MYEFNLTLNLPFEQAVEKVRETLMGEQLGVVSEIDVQAIFKAKMDKVIAPYRIMGACNPKLAERVLEAEPNAGTLLPCNFVMRTEGDATVVSFMDPASVLALSENETVREIGNEARAKLQRVADSLAGV